MSPEELTAYLPDLHAAADVVEAIDGGDFDGWDYELIPWGVRFLRRGEGEVIIQASARGTVRLFVHPGEDGR